jgi:signal transduction histidine kinase
MSDMLKRLIGGAVTIEIRLAPGLNLVEMEPGTIEQIIMNLVVNARDAMPDGGTVTISTRNGRMDGGRLVPEDGAGGEECIVLAVRDNGIGMSADTQARIFEPFFTTKGPGQGTGLGLAMIHQTVLQRGGCIQVQSEPGCGSAFTICLPATRPEARSGEYRHDDVRIQAAS